MNKQIAAEIVERRLRFAKRPVARRADPQARKAVIRDTRPTGDIGQLSAARVSRRDLPTNPSQSVQT